MCDAGAQVHTGLKGPFAINTSELSPALLQWLRDEPHFTNTCVDFDGSRRGIEEGFKREACYHTQSLRTVKKSCFNGQTAEEAAPARLCAWAHAFREVNEAALDTLYQNLKQELNKLSARQARKNGLHLRTESPKVWLFRYCSIQYMQ